MGKVMALAAKELRDILRERSIVAAIATQLFVAAFSGFLTVGLLSLYDPESVDTVTATRVAYVGPGDFLEDSLQDALGIWVFVFDDTSQALEAFNSGSVFAVVEERYDDPLAARSVTLLLPEGEVETTLVVTQLKNLLRDYERHLREQRDDRIQTEIVVIESAKRPAALFGFAFSVLLPLLLATPVFLSGAITGDSITQEINTHTLRLLRASPLSTWQLVLGKVLTPVLLAPAQVLLWIGFLYANDLPVHNLAALLLMAGLLAMVFAGASVLIAFYVESEGQSQAAYTLLVLALALASVMMPQDPLNVVARLAVGSPDQTTFAMLGYYALMAVAAVAAAFLVAERRLRRLGA